MDAALAAGLWQPNVSPPLAIMIPVYRGLVATKHAKEVLKCRRYLKPRSKIQFEPLKSMSVRSTLARGVGTASVAPLKAVYRLLTWRAECTNFTSHPSILSSGCGRTGQITDDPLTTWAVLVAELK